MDETPEAKAEVFRQLIDCYARADVDAMAPLMHTDYRGHTSAGDRDWAEFRQSILNFHELFDYGPDAFVIEDQFVSGDKVATRMICNVRNRASGEPMTMIGINLAVIRGGQIIEEWNTWEMVASPESLSMQGAA
jgi:ketosteroid isomerase-like protein